MAWAYHLGRFSALLQLTRTVRRCRTKDQEYGDECGPGGIGVLTSTGYLHSVARGMSEQERAHSSRSGLYAPRVDGSEGNVHVHSKEVGYKTRREHSRNKTQSRSGKGGRRRRGDVPCAS